MPDENEKFRFQASHDACSHGLYISPQTFERLRRMAKRTRKYKQDLIVLFVQAGIDAVTAGEPINSHQGETNKISVPVSLQPKAWTQLGQIASEIGETASAVAGHFIETQLDAVERVGENAKLQARALRALAEKTQALVGRDGLIALIQALKEVDPHEPSVFKPILGAALEHFGMAAEHLAARVHRRTKTVLDWMNTPSPTPSLPVRQTTLDWIFAEAQNRLRR